MRSVLTSGSFSVSASKAGPLPPMCSQMIVPRPLQGFHEFGQVGRVRQIAIGSNPGLAVDGEHLEPTLLGLLRGGQGLRGRGLGPRNARVAKLLDKVELLLGRKSRALKGRVHGVEGIALLHRFVREQRRDQHGEQASKDQTTASGRHLCFSLAFMICRGTVNFPPC
jgi:hypothetical protein